MAREGGGHLVVPSGSEDNASKLVVPSSSDGNMSSDTNSKASRTSPNNFSNNVAQVRAGLQRFFDLVFDSTDEAPRCSFLGHLVVNFLLVAVWDFLTILLWSSIFFGNDTVPRLTEYSMMKFPLFGASITIMATLYMLDFYVPPHLPSQYLALWDGDERIGRIILGVGVFLALIGSLFMADSYPNAPMLLFIFLCPMLLAALRVWTRPWMPQRVTELIQGADVATKLKILKQLIGQAEDLLNFYRAVMWAFFASSAIYLTFWIIAALTGQIDFSEMNDESKTHRERDLLFNKIICPLVVAIANLMYGLFALLRVVMHQSYLETDTRPLRLKKALTGEQDREVQSALQKLLDAQGIDSQEALRQSSSGRVLPHLDELEQEEKTQKSMKQLTLLVKVYTGFFVCLIGLMYACLVLVWADSHIATMFLGLVVIFFFIFVIFVFSTFSRITREIGKWLAALPIWGKVRSVMRSDWTRAFIFACMLPLIAAFLLISILNQRVRKLRGLADVTRRVSVGDPSMDIWHTFVKSIQPMPLTEEEEKKLVFTARVHTAVQEARGLNWLLINSKIYIWCLLPFIYFVGAIVFNAIFAFLIDVLSRNFEFYVIVLFTFIVGVSAFLWPTVPGMVVYIFGGLLLAQTCDIGDDRETQFWVGAGINMVVGFFLKLSACAIQQKLFGERLGTSLAVKQMCGVHTPQMRTIESILRMRGLSLGKVAILCGGPDWPVSVLCGILGLSLFQCEIGTVPIIFYIIPSGLSGSFYLRASESDLWNKASTAMVFLLTVVTGALWILMAWAIQREYELKYEELSRPRLEHLELHWLDHKQRLVRKRCAVTLADVPSWLRRSYLLGGLVQIAMSQVLVWAGSYLMGDFKVSDPASDLEWYSTYLTDDRCSASDTNVDRSMCLFSLAGVVVCSLYMLAWLPERLYTRWLRQRNAAGVAAVEEELDSAAEAAWKDEWTRRSQIEYKEISPGSYRALTTIELLCTPEPSADLREAQLLKDQVFKVYKMATSDDGSIFLQVDDSSWAGARSSTGSFKGFWTVEFVEALPEPPAAKDPPSSTTEEAEDRAIESQPEDDDDRRDWADKIVLADQIVAEGDIEPEATPRSKTEEEPVEEPDVVSVTSTALAAMQVKKRGLGFCFLCSACPIGGLKMAEEDLRAASDSDERPKKRSVAA